MPELDVKIFSIGEWNGINFTIEDLNTISNAFTMLADVHKVPLKFGHNDEQPFTDGQPALGWISKVWVDGDILMAKFIDMPEVVYQAMQKGLYKHVSVELDMGVEHSGKFFTWVLSGVALLGADIPAVNNLDDLTAFMTKDLDHNKRVVFKNTAKLKTFSIEGDQKMPKTVEELETELAAQTATNKALTTQNATLVTDNAKFSVDNAAMTAEKVAKELSDEKVEMSRKKTEFTDSLETLVKSEAITPAQREKFTADLKDDLSNLDTLNYALGTVKMSKGNSDMSGDEQGKHKMSDDDADEAEKGMSPHEIILDRTRKYMRKNGEKDFSFAKRTVLLADKDLAKKYVDHAQES